jgi:two-component system nitrate/nitrite response regulator NarL
MNILAGTVLTGVALVMSRPLVSEGLRRILAEHFETVDVVEGLDDLTDPPADSGSVVILDRDILGENLQGSLTTLVSAHPHSRFIVLVSSLDQQEAASSFAAGAYAYFLDDAPYQAFTAVAQLVALGRKVAPSELVEQIGQAPSGSARVEKHVDLESVGLTEREHLIFEFLALGQPNKAIASELGITESAVKAAVKSVLRKLSVQNRTQAAILAHDAEPHLYLATKSRGNETLAESAPAADDADDAWPAHPNVKDLRQAP